jgi:hypothetical protein
MNENSPYTTIALEKNGQVVDGSQTKVYQFPAKWTGRD